MSEFLTTKELSNMIKMAPQTIYNKIHKNEFQLGIHYLKPSRKKILFKKSAIMNWLNGDSEYQPIRDELQNNFQPKCCDQPTKITSIIDRQKQRKNLINI